MTLLLFASGPATAPDVAAGGDRSGAAATRADVDARWGEVGVLERLRKARELANGGRPAEALVLLGEAKERCGADRRCVAQVTMELGAVVQERDPGRAIQLFEDARRSYEELGDAERLSYALVQLAVVHMARGDRSAGMKLAERAVAAARQSRDPLAEALALIVLGQHRALTGDATGALHDTGSALTLLRGIEGRTARQREVAALSGYATACARLGRRREAAEALEKAAALQARLAGEAAGGNDRMRRALAALFQVQIAGQLEGFGEHDRALRLASSALREFLAIEKWDGAVLAVALLTEIAIGLEDWQNALELTKRRIALAERLRDPRALISALETEAELMEQLGKREEALPIREQLVGRFHGEGDAEGELRARQALGVSLSWLGRHERAVKELDAARSLAVESGDDRRARYALIYRGWAAYRKGDTEVGTLDLLDAAHASRLARDRDLEASALSMASSLVFREQPQLAILLGKVAVNVQETLRTDTAGLEGRLQRGYTRFVSGTYRLLADLLVAQERLDEAQEVLFALRAEEAVLVAGGSGDGAHERVHLRPEEEKIWGALDASFGVSDVTRDGADDRLALRRGALVNATAELGAWHPTRDEEGDRSQRTPTARLLAGAGAGAAAVFTVSDTGRLSLVLVAPGLRRGYQVPVSAEALWDKVKALREALRDPGRDPRPAARELYALLVAPMERDLDRAGVKTLLWSLDGALRYLPVAALHDGERWLVERYRTTLLAAGTAERSGPRTPPRWTILGLGVTRRHEDLEPLPGVAAELEALVRDEARSRSGILPGRALLDAAFTREGMASALAARPSVVHVASHYVFVPVGPSGEDESYLLLGDGTHLRPRDWDAMPRAAMGRVDLLTLSACETALGATRYRADALEGAELDGLASMLLRTGVVSVLATLWTVSDASTPALMREFYRRRQERPEEGKAAALRAAQLALIRGQVTRSTERRAGRGLTVTRPENSGSAAGDWSHPYYWAPFVLVGSAR